MPLLEITLPSPPPNLVQGQLYPLNLELRNVGTSSLGRITLVTDLGCMVVGACGEARAGKGAGDGEGRGCWEKKEWHGVFTDECENHGQHNVVCDECSVYISSNQSSNNFTLHQPLLLTAAAMEDTQASPAQPPPAQPTCCATIVGAHHVAHFPPTLTLGPGQHVTCHCVVFAQHVGQLSLRLLWYYEPATQLDMLRSRMLRSVLHLTVTPCVSVHATLQPCMSMVGTSIVGLRLASVGEGVGVGDKGVSVARVGTLSTVQQLAELDDPSRWSGCLGMYGCVGVRGGGVGVWVLVYERGWVWVWVWYGSGMVAVKCEGCLVSITCCYAFIVKSLCIINTLIVRTFIINLPLHTLSMSQSHQSLSHQNHVPPCFSMPKQSHHHHMLLRQAHNPPTMTLSSNNK